MISSLFASLLVLEKGKGVWKKGFVCSLDSSRSEGSLISLVDSY